MGVGVDVKMVIWLTRQPATSLQGAAPLLTKPRLTPEYSQFLTIFRHNLALAAQVEEEKSSRRVVLASECMSDQ